MPFLFPPSFMQPVQGVGFTPPSHSAPPPTIDLTASSQKRFPAECATEPSKTIKKRRLTKKKPEIVELDDAKEEVDAVKSGGHWKDHWVIQLVSIRGEMHSTFSAPPKQGPPSNSFFKILCFYFQFFFFFFGFLLGCRIASFLSAACWLAAGLLAGLRAGLLAGLRAGLLAGLRACWLACGLAGAGLLACGLVAAGLLACGLLTAGLPAGGHGLLWEGAHCT